MATPGRIIADLARDQLDGAHQGTVIADILDTGLLTLDDVGARLDPHAHQWDEQDGVALAHRFVAAAGRQVPRDRDPLIASIAGSRRLGPHLV